MIAVGFRRGEGKPLCCLFATSWKPASMEQPFASEATIFHHADPRGYHLKPCSAAAFGQQCSVGLPSPVPCTLIAVVASPSCFLQCPVQNCAVTVR